MQENCKRWYRDYSFTMWTYELLVVIFVFRMQNYTRIVKTAVHVVKFKKSHLLDEGFGSFGSVGSDSIAITVSP